jgi:flagellar motility protein MotE (MotC chaperone)
MRDNIQQQVDELNRLQTRIEASIEAKKTQDAENFKKVITLYDGMDPKIAAQKLEKFDVKIAAQILMGMNIRKAARLLEALPPDIAKRITETIVRKEPATK